MIAKRVDKIDLPHPRMDCNYLRTTIAETPNNVSIGSQQIAKGPERIKQFLQHKTKQ